VNSRDLQSVQAEQGGQVSQQVQCHPASQSSDQYSQSKFLSREISDTATASVKERLLVAKLKCAKENLHSFFDLFFFSIFYSELAEMYFSKEKIFLVI